MTAPPKPTAPSDDVWRPRGAIAPAEVAGYSRFVGIMRIGLPAVAVGLVLLIFAVPLFRGDDQRFRVGDTTVTTQTAIDALSMVNARYVGTDAKGQPFSVTAKSVRERTGADTRIEMTAPQADITLNGGVWMSVEAEQGLYDRDGDTLDLTGNVSLFQDQGYEMHTPAATVKLKDGAARSTASVEGQGPFGVLNAAGFDLYDKGAVVVFGGPARLVLNKLGDDAAKPEAAP